MSRGVRTATLLGAVLVFVVGLLGGFSLLTQKADTTPTEDLCENRTVAKGGELTSNLVTVNVYNASNRSGLANRVTINLQRRNFLGGEIGNNPSTAKPKRVAILTTDRDDPRVQLVARQFGKQVVFAEPDVNLPDGVTVIVGDDFKGLAKKAPNAVKSDREITVCLPTVPLT
jgi:hypothetical protein